jgi:hypothetical protein
VALLQLLEEAAGEAEFRQRGLELIVVLQLLALLRGHVGLQENLARIFCLGRQRERRSEEEETGDEQQTDLLHAQAKRMIRGRWGVATAGVHATER